MRITTRLAPVLGAALGAALVLGGCGSAGSDDRATEPDPAARETSTEPTAKPTVGSYPSFEPEDYSYTLHVACFCRGGDEGIRITVEDGEVTSAGYGDTSRGVADDDQVIGFRRVTINDIIDAANNTRAAQVDVTWPSGQDYPSSVYVDWDKRIADEGIGYAISDVEVGSPPASD